MLVRGLLPRVAALYCAALSGTLALVGGTLASSRFVLVRRGVLVDWSAPASVWAALPLAPWPMIATGLSVLAIAAAYSVPPLRLSANALGEW